MKERTIICSLCKQKRKVIDGKTLRKTRLNCGLSLRETARRIKISPAYLSDIENNKRIAPVKLIRFWRNI